MKIWSRIEWAIIVVASALLLLLLFLFSCSHPHSDDYSYTMFVVNKGFWRASVYIFQNDAGRFFSSFLLYLNPMRSKSISGYEWYTASLFIVFLLSLFLFFWVALGKLVRKKSIIFLFAFVVLFFLSFMPNIHEFCYWLCGEATYLASISLLLFSAALHFLLIQKKYNRNKGLYLLCVLNTISIAGCSEIGIFIYCLMLFVFGLYRRQFKVENEWRFYTIVIFFLASILFVFSAKGNINRHQITPFSGSFLLAITGGFYATIFWLSKWMLVFVPLSLFYILSFGQMNFLNIRLSSFRLFKSKTIILGSIFFFFFCQIMIIWMSGSMPELRTENILFLFLLISILFASQLMIQEYPIIYDVLKTRLNGLLQLLSFLYLICVFLVMPNNFTSALFDIISGRARQYNRQSIERYTLLQTNQDSVVLLPSINSRPKLLYFPTLTCNSQIDHNDVIHIALAEYFGKQWIYEYNCNTEIPDYSIKELLKQKRRQLFFEKK